MATINELIKKYSAPTPASTVGIGGAMGALGGATVIKPPSTPSTVKPPSPGTGAGTGAAGGAAGGTGTTTPSTPPPSTGTGATVGATGGAGAGTGTTPTPPPTTTKPATPPATTTPTPPPATTPQTTTPVTPTPPATVEPEVTTETPVVEPVEGVPNYQEATVVEPQVDVMEQIRMMQEAQRRSRIAALEKQRDNALMALEEEKAGIAPRYYDRKNQVAAQSDVDKMNFAQFMAGRGIKGAAGAMPEIYRNANLNSNIGALDRQEQAAYDTIGRNRTGVQNAYESDVVAASADIDAQGLQAYINQLNADRLFGLQEGELTGTYKGGQTLNALNASRNFGLQEAGLTGTYKGIPTMQAQQMQTDNEFRQKQFEEDSAYRMKAFEEDSRQFNLKYGLDLRQMTFQEAQAKIENAYRSKQLSLQQRNQALDEMKFAYSKVQDETNTQQAERQNTIEGYVKYIESAFRPRVQTGTNSYDEPIYSEQQTVDAAALQKYLINLMNSGVDESIINELASRYGL